MALKVSLVQFMIGYRTMFVIPARSINFHYGTEVTSLKTVSYFDFIVETNLLNEGGDTLL